MANKQRYDSEYEIPHDLKQKGLGLKEANKWLKYYREAFAKKLMAPRDYAWIKFKINYRRRRDGWVKAEGNWTIDDRNNLAGDLWGIWHECRKRFFPTEREWMDFYIGELIKIRNGVMIKEVEEEPKEISLEDLINPPEENESVETEPEVEKEEIEEVPDEIQFDLGEEEEPKPVFAGPQKKVITPGVIEDDGSDDENTEKLVRRHKQLRKKGVR